MMLRLFPLALLITTLLQFACAQDTRLRAVKATFDAAKIPEDAHITFDPRTLLGLTFPQPTGPPVHVKAGVQLARNQTAGPPLFALPAHTSVGRGPFVVAAVDLDAPTPQDPTNAQIRHFLGGNFAIERSSARRFVSLTNSTPALSEFRQPTPPAGSDPHRYVFLLFNQPPNFNRQTEVNATTPIQNFNISQFALDVGLGNPLGGTFIRVGPDPATATTSLRAWESGSVCSFLHVKNSGA